MTSIKDIFKRFAGAWSFERRMDSFAGEPKGHASGTATFTANGDDILHYYEEGSSYYPPAYISIPSFRGYHYQLNDDRIDVYHRDDGHRGELYQSYLWNQDDETLDPVQIHECGLDEYHGLYEIIDNNHFHLTTRVEGPGKDYVIKTLFSRKQHD